MVLPVARNFQPPSSCHANERWQQQGIGNVQHYISQEILSTTDLTTVVNVVLTSYELMLAIYLGTLDGVLDCAATILCGSDTVMDSLVSGWIISA